MIKKATDKIEESDEWQDLRKELFTEKEMAETDAEVQKICEKSILKRAESLMGNDAKAWLIFKNPDLNNKTPAEVLKEIGGFIKVDNLLLKMGK